VFLTRRYIEVYDVLNRVMGVCVCVCVCMCGERITNLQVYKHNKDDPRSIDRSIAARRQDGRGPNQFRRRRGGAVPESLTTTTTTTSPGVGYDVLSTRVIDPPPHRGAAACGRRRIILSSSSSSPCVCAYYFYTILIYAIAHVHPPTAKTLRRRCK